MNLTCTLRGSWFMQFIRVYLSICVFRANPTTISITALRTCTRAIWRASGSTARVTWSRGRTAWWSLMVPYGRSTIRPTATTVSTRSCPRAVTMFTRHTNTNITRRHRTSNNCYNWSQSRTSNVRRCCDRCNTSNRRTSHHRRRPRTSNCWRRRRPSIRRRCIGVSTVSCRHRWPPRPPSTIWRIRTPSVAAVVWTPLRPPWRPSITSLPRPRQSPSTTQPLLNTTLRPKPNPKPGPSTITIRQPLRQTPSPCPRHRHRRTTQWPKPVPYCSRPTTPRRPLLRPTVHLPRLRPSLYWNTNRTANNNHCTLITIITRNPYTSLFASDFLPNYIKKKKRINNRKFTIVITISHSPYYISYIIKFKLFELESNYKKKKVR